MKKNKERKERLSQRIWQQRWLNGIIPIGILAAWVIWGLSSNAGKGLLPTPIQVWQGFLRVLKDGTLVENIKISTIRAFKGLACGGMIGFMLGVINGISTKADKLLNAPIQMIRNVPYLAMMPLILVWFGIGELTKTILIAIGVFFPIYLNTYHGIRSIDPKYLEMAKVYEIKNIDLYAHVIFPGALPSIIVGLKQSLGRMWVILIVAEEVAAKSGIGYMVTNAREFMMMDIIVLGLILYAILGSLSDMVTTLLERVLLKWQYEGGRVKS